MKRLMIAASLLLLGCQEPQLNTNDKDDINAQVDKLLSDLNVASKRPDDQTITAYAGKIKNAIEKELPDASEWQGKVCTIRISLLRDGTLADAKTEGGDPGLCNATLAAVKKATFPPTPNEKVYQMFKNALLDFKP
jgi:colicin import membrane protein